jgi:hypothetical protein
MLLYLFFHAWYSIDSPVIIYDKNSTPNPEGYIQSFDITYKQKLTVIASKLNLCLKKYGKKISVNELYPKFEWVKPSIRISGKEGYYIASFLEQIIAYNNRRISDQKFINLKGYIINTFITDFNLFKVNELINSMIKFFKFSDSCIIIFFIYLWRLNRIIIHSKNWKNILITVMMIVVKWNEDWDWSTHTSDKHLENKEWAQFGYINLLELNFLELEICKEIKWKLFVTKKQFEIAKALIYIKYFT